MMAPPESTSAEAFNQHVSGRLIAASNRKAAVSFCNS